MVLTKMCQLLSWTTYLCFPVAALAIIDLKWVLRGKTLPARMALLWLETFQDHPAPAGRLIMVSGKSLGRKGRVTCTDACPDEAQIST